MKLLFFALILQAGVGLPAVDAQSSVSDVQRLSVSANMPIYRLEETSTDTANAPYSVDGTTSPIGSCYPRANILPTGPFSGYDNTDHQGSMVGMFLEDSLPTIVPPTLRFYGSDNPERNPNRFPITASFDRPSVFYR